MAKIAFVLNGEEVAPEVAPDTPLLWVLRDALGLTGTKYGCGIADCGACTIHVDGEARRSCVLPISAVENATVTTIEGIGKGGAGDGAHPLQAAWVSAQVPQCGYCQSGMIMAAAALLQENPQPSDAEIDDAITNICRCGTYGRIRKAIHLAAEGAE
ncbi:MAG: (2Fe-2S)-binding protein [Alphaproteobacteria bacterium]